MATATSPLDGIASKLDTAGLTAELLWSIHEPDYFAAWRKTLEFAPRAKPERSGEVLWIKTTARWKQGQPDVPVTVAIFINPRDTQKLCWSMRLEKQATWSIRDSYPDLDATTVPKSLLSVLTEITDAELTYSPEDWDAWKKPALLEEIKSISSKKLKQGTNFKGRLKLPSVVTDLAPLTDLLKTNVDFKKLIESLESGIAVRGVAGTRMSGQFIRIILPADFKWELVKDKVIVAITGMILEGEAMESDAPQANIGFEGTILGGGATYDAELMLIQKCQGVRLVAERRKGKSDEKKSSEWLNSMLPGGTGNTKPYLESSLAPLQATMGDVSKLIPSLDLLDLTLRFKEKSVTAALRLGYDKPFVCFSSIEEGGLFKLRPELDVWTDFTKAGTQVSLRGEFEIGKSRFDLILGLPSADFSASLADGSTVDLSGFVKKILGPAMSGQPRFQVVSLDIDGNGKNGNLSVAVAAIGELEFPIGATKLVIRGVSAAMYWEDKTWSAQLTGDMTLCKQDFSIDADIRGDGVSFALNIPVLKLDEVFREITQETLPEQLEKAIVKDILLEVATGANAKFVLEAACDHTFKFDGFTVQFKELKISYLGKESKTEIKGKAAITIGKTLVDVTVEYKKEKEGESDFLLEGAAKSLESNAVIGDLTSSFGLQSLPEPDKSKAGNAELKVKLAINKKGTTLECKFCTTKNGKTAEFPIKIHLPAARTDADAKNGKKPQDPGAGEILSPEKYEAAIAAADSSPFAITVNKARLALLELDVTVPRAGKGEMRCALLLTENVLLAGEWKQGGSLVIVGQIEKIDLGALIQSLGKGIGIDLPSYKLVLKQSSVRLVRQTNGDTFFFLGTKIDGVGALALNVFKQDAGWALAFGIHIDKDKLDEKTELGKLLKSGMSFISLSQIYLVASTASCKELQLTTPDNLVKPQVNPPLAVQRGLTIKAKWDLEGKADVAGLPALLKMMGIKGGVLDVDLNIQDDSFNLSTKITNVVIDKHIRLNGEFGFKRKRGSSPEIYLEAVTNEIPLFDQKVKFALSASASASGIFLTGSMTGTLQVSKRVVIANLGVGIGASPTGAAVGFTGQISVGDFSGFVALALTTDGVAFSAAISDLSLYQLASGLVNVPGSMKPIFEEIRVFGLQKATTSYKLALGPDNKVPEKAVFPAALTQAMNQVLGEKKLDPEKMYTRPEENGWYVFDQANMAHYLVRSNPKYITKVDIFEKVQIYYAANATKLGPVEIPRGFKCVLGLQIIDFEALVSIEATSEGLSAYCKLKPLIFTPCPSLFSLIAMGPDGKPNDKDGPLLSLSTYDFPAGTTLLPGQLQKKHFRLNGCLKLLGAVAGVKCEVTAEGMDLHAIFRMLDDAVKADLRINYGKKNGLIVAGSFEVRLDEIDLLVKKVRLDAGIKAAMFIHVGGPSAALIARFRAQAKFQGTEYDLGEFRVDITYGEFNDFKGMIENEVMNKAASLLGLEGPKQLKEKGRWMRIRLVNDTGYSLRYAGKGDKDMGVSHGRYWQKPTHIPAYEEGVFSVCNRDNSWTGVGGVAPFELRNLNDASDTRTISIAVSDPVLGGRKCYVDFGPHDAAKVFGRIGSATKNRTYQSSSNSPKFRAIAQPGELSLVYLHEPGRRVFRMLGTCYEPGGEAKKSVMVALTAAGRFLVRRRNGFGEWGEWSDEWLHKDQSLGFTSGRLPSCYFVAYVEGQGEINCIASKDEWVLRNSLRAMMPRVSYIGAVPMRSGSDLYLLAVDADKKKLTTAALRDNRTIDQIRTINIDDHNGVLSVARKGYQQVFLLGKDKQLHSIIAMHTSQMPPAYAGEHYIHAAYMQPLAKMMGDLDSLVAAHAKTANKSVKAPSRERPVAIAKFTVATESVADSMQIFAIDDKGKLWMVRHEYDRPLREAERAQKVAVQLISESSFEWTAWQQVEMKLSEDLGSLPLLHIAAEYSIDGYLELFAILEDGTLCHSRSEDRGKTWRPWEANFRSAPKLASVSCAPHPDGKGMDVYGIGREDRCGHTLHVTGQGWQAKWKEVN